MLIAVELFPPLLVQAAWWMDPATHAVALAIAQEGGRLLATCPARRSGRLCSPADAGAGTSAVPGPAHPLPPRETAAWLWARAVRSLLTISPVVEETDLETGVFSLDTRGLERLWGETVDVAEAALQALREAGLAARVGGGPGRVVALACAQRLGQDRPLVYSGAQARSFLAALPLEEPALSLPLRVAVALRELGITTAGALAALPIAGLALRFGPEVVPAWQRAGGQGADEPPLRPAQPARMIMVEEHGEEGVGDYARAGGGTGAAV